jgi:hypothetical protein
MCHSVPVFGAVERTRTSTAFRPMAPKAIASANSATTALRKLYIFGSLCSEKVRLLSSALIQHHKKKIAETQGTGKSPAIFKIIMDVLAKQTC